MVSGMDAMVEPWQDGESVEGLSVSIGALRVVED
ncbi:hypothetical protein SIAM614_06228 [Stappia aggregata IAM 12614]|uniref:Uncharacterized protein n=1 Tax=Roseibium aggregatum (strain ATCC 25650 / DSM 13394 / JCM 20685 / NBRC 16684 / NCIMB 2208 / IAM 12614 / B1) TaxID=384765 RepID=A0NV91_ROSAI|nr:hypothetical protein SIAM614_06228 [Stappia aggregata IAM 12614] [Roseibium aggregatum IAM 12614]